MTVEEIIEIFGGPAETARVANVGLSAISNWKKAGVIPPKRFLPLAVAAAEMNVKLDPSCFREVRKANAEAV